MIFPFLRFSRYAQALLLPAAVAPFIAGAQDGPQYDEEARRMLGIEDASAVAPGSLEPRSVPIDPDARWQPADKAPSTPSTAHVPVAVRWEFGGRTWELAAEGVTDEQINQWKDFIRRFDNYTGRWEGTYEMTSPDGNLRIIPATLRYQWQSIREQPVNGPARTIFRNPMLLGNAALDLDDAVLNNLSRTWFDPKDGSIVTEVTEAGATRLYEGTTRDGWLIWRPADASSLSSRFKETFVEKDSTTVLVYEGYELLTDGSVERFFLVKGRFTKVEDQAQ